MTSPQSVFSAFRQEVLPVTVFALVPMVAYYLAVSAGLVGVWPGILMAVVYFVYFAARDHQHYSWTTFGERRTVESRSVETSDESCAACGEAVSIGVERTYAEQSVAFGFPLRTTDWGENTYCAACAAEEFPSEYAEAVDPLDRPATATDRDDDLELA